MKILTQILPTVQAMGLLVGLSFISACQLENLQPGITPLGATVTPTEATVTPIGTLITTVGTTVTPIKTDTTIAPTGTATAPAESVSPGTLPPSTTPSTTQNRQSFANPIDSAGQDPWVTFRDGYYYYCKSLNGDRMIGVAKAKRLQDIGTVPMAIVYVPPSGTMYSQELWAPELHYIDGKWYIYFAADNGNNNNHRMFVLESKTQDPQGEYTFKGKIADATDKWAIDGTVLVTDNGEKYFIWSGWEGNTNVRQNIYIARMSNPYTIVGDRVEISRPSLPWETNASPNVNEGPEVLKKDGVVNIIYSASGSWTDNYCLGKLTNTDGNVMNPASWEKSGPVFSKTATSYGPGHASFVTSPDGTENWIVYHANQYSGTSWGGRSIRMQPFTWSGSTPVFGEPVKYGALIPEPSGTSASGVAIAKLEAESAYVNHAKVRYSANASDSYCVGYIDYTDSYVEFTVTSASGGLTSLNVIYGNGTGKESSYRVTVNNAPARRLALPSTNGWERWTPASMNIELKPGMNTIRLSKGDSYAELDRIELISTLG